MKCFLLFLFLILGVSAQAEYRVFALRITKKSSDPNLPPIERFVLSTLDPEQYRGYYPVQPDEIVEYTDTWMCYGRTDEFKDLCPNPKKAQIPEGDVSNPVAP